jgi:nitrite reductase (NADH) small subunit
MKTAEETVEQWVRLCGVAEAPAAGMVVEVEVDGVMVCLANVRGELSALDNVCPHRQGPLGQGWIEGEAVVCPWHSWAFDVRTGAGVYPEKERVAVFPVRVEGENVLIDLGSRSEGESSSERRRD